jgi:outer membrane receptor for Fe3+-dicitrate
MLANYKLLRRYINKYNGTIVHGVLVTKSGVLAAAHLGGVGNVRKWFRRGIEFKDANGTKITSYMKQFGGYNLDI